MGSNGERANRRWGALAMGRMGRTGALAMQVHTEFELRLI